MQSINGDVAFLNFERVVHEFRCGRAVYCWDEDAPEKNQLGVLAAAAETSSDALLMRFERASGAGRAALAITAERAEALGLMQPHVAAVSHGTSIVLRFHQQASPSVIKWLAGATASYGEVMPWERGFSMESGDELTTAMLALAKHARLLPAVVVIGSPRPAHDVLTISASELQLVARADDIDLERVSEARVPLAGHEHCKLVLFRDRRYGAEHVAVLIGSPQSDATAVRLHSACLTGDLLASLRCDCGEQLRSAVDQLAAVGGGVLLYLAQEGRGIGLANKLRAYQLQDSGLDTIDADRHLGFSADERNYAAAGSMLRQLGHTRIHLLTNNVEKIEALRQAGIEVVTGQRLIGTVNRHNARYVHAKRERAGHLVPKIDLDEIN